MDSNLLPLTSHEQLGRALRSVRQEQGLRQDEVGRLSHSFVGEVENGKPTAQIGKVFELLHELGVRLYVELPANMSRKPSKRQGRAAKRQSEP